MKILIEVDVERIEGRNLSAEDVAAHICDNLIAPGDDRAGNLWVGGDQRGLGATHYTIKAAYAREPG